MNALLTPVTLGALTLKNRVVMAPMTRSRATPDGTPTTFMTEYYRQRASAGLIISEGVYPCEDGKGYCRTPGIVTREHVDKWHEITRAVHEEGGKIVMQLMHCGRIGHPFNKQKNSRTLAPSAITASGEIFTEQGMQAFEPPAAMTLQDIKTTIQDYQRATEKAFEAGFDGVELHCTSGYLPAQFLSTGTNTRTDDYGGNITHRIRFVLEVLTAMCQVNGSQRVGIRICPGNPFNDLSDHNPVETYTHLLENISPLQLAYLHAIQSPQHDIHVINLVKKSFTGKCIINDSFTAETGNTVIQEKQADAVSFGRAFIANPDLVDRIQHNYPLARFKPTLLYTPGKEGYSDYPNYSVEKQ